MNSRRLAIVAIIFTLAGIASCTLIFNPEISVSFPAEEIGR